MMPTDQAEPAEPPPVSRPGREETREPVTIEATADIAHIEPAPHPETGATPQAPPADVNPPAAPPPRRGKGLGVALVALIVAAGGLGYWNYQPEISDRIAALFGSSGANAPSSAATERAVSPPPQVSADDLATLERKLDARLTQIETAFKSAADQRQRQDATMDQRLAALKSAVDAVPAPAPTSAEPPPPAPAVDLAPIDRRLADLDQRLTELSARPLPPPPPVDLSPLDQRLAALEQRVQSLEDAGKAAKSEVRATPASPEVNGARKAAEPAALIGVATAMGQAIEQGAPFTTALAAARAAGAPDDLLAPLAAVADKGAPTSAMLLQIFVGSEKALLAAVQPATAPDDSLAGRLAAAASKLVTVRPAGDPGGSDPAALVVRIEDALRHGAPDAALAAWGQLPAPAQAASRAFADAARVHIAAATAAKALGEVAMGKVAEANKPEAGQ